MLIRHLDEIGKVFGEPPGWLYHLYIEECFTLSGKVSKRRVRPYLIRCAEIGRYDCIEKIASILLDQAKNIDILFSTAEQLFQKGKHKESAYFFN
ncbi:hypothetical protein C4A76_24085 [Brevibacillus laterosporus]|uniref:Uncharacterized protein n=1 Tax=Brevibacillus laterosporus TaxID=1465 RepID=A0AAP8QFE1_BRELA|nr:hypothetical protein C4A76_24085 [Brevibacillus laterosporus]PPB08898.1 hypothetical protein C4A77_06320 [Brevibacillus laterosporus]